ncbi:unnamed protein product [Enterobius vermicularis]|uniref:BTB_2 domain-containing protein n=1 Tax=Enterobius vermicularis TaxID=51028 RepID=A0A0N4VQ85_ENTVE|nr:unnamed protein product [Enterobius vermicularis]
MHEKDEYYFERSPKLFDSIFKHYVSGHLHRPLDVCVEEFRAELNYWNISENAISPCCWRPNCCEQSKNVDADNCERKGLDYFPMVIRTPRQRIYEIFEGDGSVISNLFIFANADCEENTYKTDIKPKQR